MLDRQAVGQVLDRQATRAFKEQVLENAINAIIDEGMKLRTAARAFEVLATSLRDHLYRPTTTRQRGNRPTLKPHEE